MAKKPTKQSVKKQSPKKKSGSKEKAEPKAKPESKGKVVTGKLKNVDLEKDDQPSKGTPQVKQTALVEQSTVEKVLSELIKFIESKKTEGEDAKSSLFEDDAQSLYTQVTSTKFFSDKTTLKPKIISIPHRPVSEDFKICLFIRDDVISDELLEKIEKAKIPHLGRIVAAKELKGEFKPYDARRKLLSEYDMFLCDDRLITTLPKLLGKIFFDNSTKMPLPIRLASSNSKSQEGISLQTVGNQFKKMLNSVSYVPPMGVNISIKVGDTSLEVPKLAENVMSIVSHFEQLSDKKPLRSLQLKSQSSVSLPIYYADKIYSEEDVVDEESADKKQPESEPKLTQFEKGLLELAVDEDESNKLMRQKMKKIKNLKRASKQDERKAKKAKA